MSTWRQGWTAVAWQKFLEEGECSGDLGALRRSTHAGRPLGPSEFVRGIEEHTGRRLTPGKRGRPRKYPNDPTHSTGMLKASPGTREEGVQK